MDPDEHVPLGKTALVVSRLGLGTAPLGGLFAAVDEAQAVAVAERAYEHGMRLFDTAPLYGYGLAERRLGRALAHKPRASFVLATKVGRLLRADAPADERQYVHGEPLFKGTPGVNPLRDYSYDGVMRSLEESLKRLGLDRVDIVYIHDPEQYFAEALRGAYPALDRLRSEGTIKAVGIGMNQAEMLVRFARDVDVDCFLLAGRYTLLDQVALQELLPLCLDKRIAIVAGGVYNSGILADPRPGATFDSVPASQEVIERAVRLQSICHAHGVPLKAAAIQFPLGHPAVASVLVGSRSVAEIDENVAMFRHHVPADLWQELQAEHLICEHAPVPGSRDAPHT
ncbi:MAG TPA: aldo/keto reductase [Chloroflexota bacterium]|nr:aldo/keto reductase [Chloroflexota bacterium]